MASTGFERVGPCGAWIGHAGWRRDLSRALSNLDSFSLRVICIRNHSVRAGCRTGKPGSYLLCAGHALQCLFVKMALSGAVSESLAEISIMSMNSLSSWLL